MGGWDLFGGAEIFLDSEVVGIYSGGLAFKVWGVGIYLSVLEY